MKKLLVIIITFLTFIPFQRVLAPSIGVTWIERPQPVDGFEPLIWAVVQVESSGNIFAYNYEERACGPMQIRQIRLDDYNRRTGKYYQTWDVFDLSVSREIFLYYARNTGYPNFEKIAKSWNGSGPLTVSYWKRVKKYL